jgi:hypothetical protein
MDVNKSYSKNLFLKLRTIIIGIKLRSSVVSLLFLTIILTVVLVINLGT